MPKNQNVKNKTPKTQVRKTRKIQAAKSGKQTSVKKDYVTCDRHGYQPGGIVCNHLCMGGWDLGFWEPSPVPRGTYEAWCNECEIKFIEYGGDYELFDKFAYLRSVCKICFESIRERNAFGGPVHD